MTSTKLLEGLMHCNPIYLGVAGVIGLAIGYLLVFLMQKKNTRLWEARLAESKERLERTKREASAQLNAEREKVTASQRELETGQKKLSELQQKLGELQKQEDEARRYIEELEAAHAKQQAQAEAHWNAKQQAEGRCKQAEAMAAQAQKRLEQLETELRTAQAEVNGWKEAVNQKNQELEQTRAQMLALKRSASSGAVGQPGADVFAGAEHTLEGVLKVLMLTEQQQAAVLSDANGITVAAAGDSQLKEGMAATTQLVSNFSKQLDGMVPFQNVHSFHLEDTKANVLSGRTFTCAGEVVGLVTFGPRLPSENVLEGAVANLSAILE